MAELGLPLALLMSWLGFSGLALTMTRHWAQVIEAPEPSPGWKRALSFASYAALAISLIVAVLREGPSFGSLVWVLALMMSAATVAFTLTWRPQWLRPLAWVICRCSSLPSQRLK